MTSLAASASFVSVDRVGQLKLLQSSAQGHRVVLALGDKHGHLLVEMFIMVALRQQHALRGDLLANHSLNTLEFHEGGAQLAGDLLALGGSE